MTTHSKTALNTLIAGAFAATMTLGASAANAEETAVQHEKCYGVVKAGKNDCGNANGSHSCAGMAATDAEAGEWINLPKGICERLAGGSLEPAADHADDDATDADHEDHGDDADHDHAH